MGVYASLEQIKKYLGHASPNTEDDELLFTFLKQSSRAVDQYTRRKFYPRQETRYYDLPKNARQLRLDDDLLEVTTFSTMNGASPIGSTIMLLGTGDEWNRSPYDRIILRDDSGSMLMFSATGQRSQVVNGIWGYHEDYSHAWVDTGTSLAASYALNGKTLEIAGAGSYGTGASDENGEAPRFAVGDTLRIGDQFFFVLGGGTSGNGTIVVKPHVEGTTAASIPVGSSITKFSPEPDIQFATIRLASWMYGQKDTPYATKQSIPQFGVIVTEYTWPPDVKDRLERYKRFTLAVYPGVR